MSPSIQLGLVLTYILLLAGQPSGARLHLAPRKYRFEKHRRSTWNMTRQDAPDPTDGPMKLVDKYAGKSSFEYVDMVGV